MCDPTAINTAISKLSSTRKQKKKNHQKQSPSTPSVMTMSLPSQSLGLIEESMHDDTSISSHGEHHSSGGDRLIALSELENSLFPMAIKTVFCVWFTMVAMVYSLAWTNPEHLVYLEGGERETAMMACGIFVVSIGVTLMPMFYLGNGQSQMSAPKAKLSSILKCLIVVQTVAGTTNFMLAFLPTVVVVDPHTHARVYMIRWCEWIPLSGFMTFLAESVDSNVGTYGILVPVLVALSQSLSCLCAVVLPYCPNWHSWIVVMTLSCVLWACMFPRLYYKYQAYQELSKNGEGISMPDMERAHRTRFAFHLFRVCTCVWSLLVLLYFVNMAAYYLWPDSIIVQNQSLAMIVDTIFDVTAKAFYMRLIVNVHEAVFDAQGKAKRELQDLKRMTSVLWEASSDVIVITVAGARGHINTMISPMFPSMIGVSCGTDQEKTTAALMVKSSPVKMGNRRGKQNKSKKGGDNNNENGWMVEMESSSKFVESSLAPNYEQAAQGMFATSSNQSVASLPCLQMDYETMGFVNEQAGALIQAAWSGVLEQKKKKQDSDVKVEELVILSLTKKDGSPLKCEIKLSSHSDHAVIAVVRDVTERYLRHEAERRAHEEYQARQKEALTVNRFTRHEIKNGLLAGIELCQEACKLAAAVQLKRQGSQNQLMVDPGEEHSPVNCIAQLDQTLHEVLDTVLAEAMAREIVHESYKPKLERIILKNTLAGGSKLPDEAQKQRFPVHICPESTPPLSMDPQLLKYIHRNAVSNAVKYGKNGGRVTTEVHYFEKKGEFELDVINEPGPWNEVLMAMGEEATAAVFAQGQRLKVHDSISDETQNNISSGDGAWIMQRCAKTMGGECTIRFDPHQTVFSFRCKVEPYTLPWKANDDFQVPPGTFGMAYDDSNIQRKLMKRIFSYAGVEDDKIIVKGREPTDIKGFEKLLKKILFKNKKSNVLVLMDENLDYETYGENKRMSGSKYAQLAYQKLSKADQDRVFLLVRSANDADSDIALYNQRTHGFFPKATIQKDRIRELLGPAWYQRFPSQYDDGAQPVPAMITTTSYPGGGAGGDACSVLGNKDAVDSSDRIPVAKPFPRRTISAMADDSKSTTQNETDPEDEQEVKSTTGSLFDLDLTRTTPKSSVGSLFDIQSSGGSLFGLDDDSDDDDDHASAASDSGEIWALTMKIDKVIKEDGGDCDWDNVWSMFHALKGDLPALGDNKNIAMTVQLIESLRGEDVPESLQDAWAKIYERVLKQVQGGGDE